jgi:hypothetical protein
LRPATTTRAARLIASCVAIRPDAPVAPSTRTFWPAVSSASHAIVVQAAMPGLSTTAADAIQPDDLGEGSGGVMDTASHQQI